MTPDELILELRDKVATLERRIDRLTDRPSEPRQKRLLRQAITVPDKYGNYPAQEDCPNTYAIVFVDGDFPKVQGRQAHTLDYRQELSDPQEVAHCRWDGYEAYCPIYSLIGVEFHESTDPSTPGGWWFDHINVYPCPSSSSGESSSGEETSSGETSSGEPSSSAGETTIDVVVCSPIRVCTQGTYYYQKRIHLPSGAWVEDVPGTMVWDSQCDSSSWVDESSSAPDSSAPDSSAPDSSAPDSSSGETPPPDSSSGETSSDCTGLCGWVWTGESWSQTSTTCPDGCTCDEPDFSGTSSGEGTATFCYPDSSSAPPPDSSSAETSSVDEGPPSSSADSGCGTTWQQWIWNGSSWDLGSNPAYQCPEGCTADPPDHDGITLGDLSYTPCHAV